MTGQRNGCLTKSEREREERGKKKERRKKGGEREIKGKGIKNGRINKGQ